MAQHKDLTTAQGIHKPYAFEYADATARTTASGLVSDDVGKLALQTNDGTIWRLTATTPTWEQVVQNTQFIGHTGDTNNPHAVAAADVGAVNAASVTAFAPNGYTAAADTVQGNLQGVSNQLETISSGGSSGDIQFADGSGGFNGASMLTLGQEATKPDAPAAGKLLVYGKTDDKLYFQTDAGAETEVGGGGGAEGSDTEVQFNDGGDFAGDNTFLFTKGTNTLQVKNLAVTTSLDASLSGVTGNLTGNVTGNLAGTPTAPQVILSEGSSPSTPDGATAVYTNTKKVITTLDENAISRTLYGTRPVNGVRVDGNATQFLKIPDGEIIPSSTDFSLMWLTMWSAVPQRETFGGAGGSDNFSMMSLGAGVGGSGDGNQMDVFQTGVDKSTHLFKAYWGINLKDPAGNTTVSKEGQTAPQCITGFLLRSGTAAGGDKVLYWLIYSPAGFSIGEAKSSIEADLDLSAVGAQIGTGQSDKRVSGVVTGVCSVDTTSGFPLTRMDELRRALAIWYAEGEFRPLAAGELSGGVASGVTSPAVDLFRYWAPGDIAFNSTTGVVGTGAGTKAWEARDSTGELEPDGDMTVEGTWSSGPFLSQQIWRP